MSKLTHPVTGHEINVDEGSVEFWTAAGYRGVQGSGSSDAPAKSDTKAAWVDYAVAQGAERDEAEGSTKAELIDRFGA